MIKSEKELFLKMHIFIDFLNPENCCVRNNNIPNLLIGVKFSLIAGEDKLHMSENKVIRNCLGPGSIK
jgi:hypothetical protein